MAHQFSGADMVEQALATLAGLVVLTEEAGAQSHVVISAEGLDKPEAIRALGTYLVGALAGVVQIDIRLANRFLGINADGPAELRQRVERVVGDSNEFVDAEGRRRRDTRRNPWIAEGIGHLLLFMAGRDNTGCLAGRVAAVKALHAGATQQGLDLVAIYALEDLPALAIGETKATRDAPGERLSEAASFFRQIEAGERDGDLVADVTMLEAALALEVRQEIGEAFWRERRTYLPLIVHGTDFDAHAERPNLSSLSVARDHKRVVVFALPAFDGFFDDVANAMRAAVAELMS